jgi:hypothetical protein
MPRIINDHVINPANDKLVITAVDEPGDGKGINHRYDVSGFDTKDNPGNHGPDDYCASYSTLPIVFQNGPIAEVGINGLTQEVLLAIVMDRLRSFQKGPFACRENAIALTKIEEALHWLQQRTIARMRRGVEGTSKV